MFAAQWQRQFNALDSQAEDFLPRALSLLAELEPDAVDSAHQLRSVLLRLIAAIDSALSRQLSAVLSAPAFRQLEGLWRNLHSTVALPRSAAKVKVKLLDVTWEEIA
ncbi:MAG: type VI secretion system contractile sheath domain-containing protein, partial [Pseudomonadales bacterium]